MNNIGNIVLAAGGSVRMGRPKQLLRMGEKSLLRNAALAAADSGAGCSVVVLGSHVAKMLAELHGIGVATVINPQWERGIGSSIRCGLQGLLEFQPDTDWLCISLCDMPFVTGPVVRRLLSSALRADRPITVSQYGDESGPPVIFRRDYFAALSELPDACGAREIWTRQPANVHYEPCREAGFDIDTPADYMRLMRSCDWFPADAVAMSRGILDMPAAPTILRKASI
jgi:molybdenum cofactor cytidylyltransferase